MDEMALIFLLYLHVVTVKVPKTTVMKGLKNNQLRKKVVALLTVKFLK